PKELGEEFVFLRPLASDFYFSRVFKKCTGASPSEFRAGCEEKVNDVAVKLS
ncbi:hypothetical protein RJ926_34650, partial [Pseudomonas aeruginosa]